MATIIKKFRLYGPKNFLLFSLLEIKRQFLKFFQHSYSQHGEDLIIQKISRNNLRTFIDIGSNHPQRFNNTYHFYRLGARGVNLDPNQSLIKLFKKFRPEDISLPYGVGLKNETKIFYQMDPDVDSSFDFQHTQQRIQAGCTVEKKYPAQIITLADIFKKYFPKKPVDLLNIDTEGYDYLILKSNDWSKYRPQIICIEDNSLATKKLLQQHNYQLVATTPLNSIYVLN